MILEKLIKYQPNKNPNSRTNPPDIFFFLLLIYIANRENYLKEKTLSKISQLFPSPQDITFGNGASNSNINLFQAAEYLLLPEKVKDGLNVFWQNSRLDNVSFIRKLIMFTNSTDFLWVIAESKPLNLGHSVILSCLESGPELLSLNKETPLSRLVTILRVIKDFEKEEKRINRLNSFLSIEGIKNVLLKNTSLKNIDKHILTFLSNADLSLGQKQRIINHLDK